MSVRKAQNTPSLRRSYYGEAVLEKNPLEGKELKRTLMTLERDRKCREQEVFWKQRQFFIERAFDQDKQLRFVRLKERIQNAEFNKEQKLLPAIQKFDTSLRSRLFPTSFNEEAKKTSTNFKKIEVCKEKLCTAMKVWQSARKWKRTSQKSKHNESLDLPNLKENDGDDVANISGREDVSKDNFGNSNTVLLPIHRMSGDETKDRGRSQSLSMDIESNDKSTLGKPNKENYIAAKLSWVRAARVILGNRKGSFSDDQDDDTDGKTSEEYRDAVEEEKEVIDSTTKCLLEEILTENESNTAPVENKMSSKPKAADDLLLKITMTLPAGMFGKTKDTLSNLSSALGFEARNKRLIEREKTFSNKEVLMDDRFQKLQNVLSPPQSKNRQRKGRKSRH